MSEEIDKWHKPTEKQKLDAANAHYGLTKKKHKHLNWLDKLKIAVYEHEAIKDADFEIIEPKQLTNQYKINNKI